MPVHPLQRHEGQWELMDQYMDQCGVTMHLGQDSSFEKQDREYPLFKSLMILA